VKAGHYFSLTRDAGIGLRLVLTPDEIHGRHHDVRGAMIEGFIPRDPFGELTAIGGDLLAQT
jgi:hypothetical protein